MHYVKTLSDHKYSQALTMNEATANLLAISPFQAVPHTIKAQGSS